MSMLRVGILETPLGEMVAASVRMAAGETTGPPAESLCVLEFHERKTLPNERRELEQLFGCTWPDAGPLQGVLKETAKQVARYFEGKLKEFTIPLYIPGTPFQCQVWNELRRIPYGQTISYVELASRVKTPRGTRAVGQANGKNRICLMVPCHRVIDASGKLGGYGGGLWRKQRLLELEGALKPACV
jgi:AraC family transcriptional regulator, regulatory protein of adaptative response / methylated-DNA-[protein]-cysteine methyltransferase